MKATGIAAFIISTLASYAVLTPGSASATSAQNYPGNMCVSWVGPGLAGVASLFNSGYQLENTSATGEAALICPLISNGSAISSADIWFYSNGDNTINANADSIGAAVCQQAAAGGAGVCGTQAVYSGAAGNSSIAVTTTEYSNSAFNFIVVDLGHATTAPDYNKMLGYQIVLGSS